MSDRIRAALQRLTELEGHTLVDCTADWAEAMIEARAALAAEAEHEVAGPTDNDLLACMIEAARSVPDGQAIGIADWDQEAIAAARAVLARYGHQPAPPAEDVLTDKELDALMPQQMQSDLEAAVVARSANLGFDKAIGICRFSVYKKARAYARAAIAADRARYSHHPAPPADGEVGELVALIREAIRAWVAWEEGAVMLNNMTEVQLTRAADLLEQRHPVPVPVAERLPGAEDCDAEERCWLLAPRWILPPSELTHWLPATALPLPAGEVQP